MDPDDNIQYFEGIANQKIVNGKKIFNCTQCGECCHIREEKDISEAEEMAYRQYMFTTFGIVYLANLKDITINVYPEEADLLRAEAKRRGMELNIRPKRAVYDEKENRLIVLDYFIDHNICPFFNNKERTCSVYDIRPTICHAYPLLGGKNLGKCKYKLLNTESYGEEKFAATKLEEITHKQKELIKQMIISGEIVVPKAISEEEFQKILLTANLVELRIMKKN